MRCRLTGLIFAYIVIAYIIGMSPLRAETSRPATSDSCPKPDHSENFTYFCDGATILVPDDAAHLALLIGNTAYDMAGTSTENVQETNMEPLPNACPDILSIARSLAAIGWRKDEILVLCNQNGDQMRRAVNRFLVKRPISKDEAKPMLIYFSGHGIDIAKVDYMIGVSARPDWIDRSKEYMRSIENGTGMEFLEEDEGLNLYERFGQLNPKINFPLVVFVDACRDNPTADVVDQEFLRAKNANNSKALQILFASRPGPTTNLPEGVEIDFATKSGSSTVDDDGHGHSRMAGALLAEMKPGRTIESIIQSMKEDIRSGNLGDNNDQDMQRDGHLNAPDYGAWLISDNPRRASVNRSVFAARADASSEARLIPTNLIVHRSTAFEAPAGSTSSSLVHRPSRVAMAQSDQSAYARFKIDDQRNPLTLHLFWCTGGSKENERRSRLLRFAQMADEYVKGGNGHSGMLEIASIVVQAFSPLENASPQYQRYDDAIYADPEQIDPDEYHLGLALKALTGLNVREAAAPHSPGYISVFFCRGAPESKTTIPAVYVQVADHTNLASASSVITFLQWAEPDLYIVPKAEVMDEKTTSDGKQFDMSKYPSGTDVRYYRNARRKDAENIGYLLSSDDAGKAYVRPHPIYGYGEHNYLEVWLGKDVSDQALEYLPYTRLPPWPQ